jgi:EmrB/QacA subfamily drug resistance transporter
MERRWRTFAVVAVGVFLSSLDLFIVNVAFPDIARDFRGTSTGDLSWVLNAYAIVYAALLVPAGRLADLLGRRRAYLTGLLGFVVASALCAAAPSAPALVGARVLQAAAAALLLPTSLGLMLPEFDAAEYPVAIAAWAAVAGAAAAAGPPLGGLLVQLSWRWIFIVNIPVGLLSLAAGARVLRERRAAQGTSLPDLAGTAALVGSVTALVLGIVKAPDWGWADVRTIAAVGASAALAAVVLTRSRRHRLPVLELSILRARGFAIASAATFTFFAGFAATLLASVLLLTGPWGKSVLVAGLMIAPGPLAAAVTAIVGGRLAARLGVRTLGVAGGVLYAAAAAWWALRVSSAPHLAADFLPGMIVAGVGVGLVTPSLTGAAVASLAPDRLSAGIGALTMFRQIATALGVAILIAILGSDASVGAYRAAWLFIGACAIATSVLLGQLGALGEPAGDLHLEGAEIPAAGSSARS